MNEIVTRSGITPVGSSKYRINRLRYHLLAYSISQRAKLNGLNAKYIIRCDDTNAESSDRSFLYAYIEVLKEIGVHADLWPYDIDQSGHSLFQSERSDLYHTYIQQLINKGLAYTHDTGAIFFDTIAFERQFRHRLKDGKIEVPDMSMGMLSIDIRTSLSDKSGKVDYLPFPLTRSNGSPLFNIASPVDDALLGITHVVREKGKLSLLHNQEMVRIALGFPNLTYVHAPLIVNNEGKKLVYDNYYGDATYQNFIEHGVTADGLISYLLSTLAGAPEKFYVSIDEFAQSTDFTKIHKANTTFAPSVLEGHNKEAVRVISEKEYESALQNYLSLSDKKAYQLLITNDDIKFLLLKARRNFIESSKIIKYILEPEYGEIRSDLKNLIYSLLNKFSEVEIDRELTIDSLLDEKCINVNSVRKKEYYQAMRYILTGEYHGYDLHEIIEYLLNKGLVKKRFETAKKQIVESNNDEYAK